MKVNNGISDSEYVASVISEATTIPYPQVIYSNSKEIVEEQRHVFEALWRKATPVEQRIREIGEGILSAKTKVLEDYNEISTAEWLRTAQNVKRAKNLLHRLGPATDLQQIF